MGWIESGETWGERAADWACLVEPYARRANDALFDRGGVGPGTRLLDIACGSGYAASVAAGRGATVAGLDASEALIAIARARTPDAAFQVGDMFELSPADHVDATLNQGGTGRPGVAEQMLADAGLEFVDRGAAQVINEWPDLDLAARALASAGPSWPALRRAGYDRFAEAIREAIRPMYTPGLGVRIISEFGWGGCPAADTPPQALRQLLLRRLGPV
jgi:SAM-dependent methyltransferase